LQSIIAPPASPDFISFATKNSTAENDSVANALVTKLSNTDKRLHRTALVCVSKDDGGHETISHGVFMCILSAPELRWTRRSTEPRSRGAAQVHLSLPSNPEPVLAVTASPGPWGTPPGRPALWLPPNLKARPFTMVVIYSLILLLHPQRP
jgi:hypothetical protein